MRRVLLLGGIFLGLAAPAAAEPITTFRTVTVTNVRPHHRYWWPAMDNCTISDGTYRNGTWHASPYVQCAGDPSHYSSTPAPAMAGLSACQVDNWGDPAAIAACTPPDELGS